MTPPPAVRHYADSNLHNYLMFGVLLLHTVALSLGRHCHFVRKRQE
jgi:hypothetical protein